MAKVTSKLQVTIPKAIADRYAIRPGDDVEWVPEADSVRVIPSKMLRQDVRIATRLKLFDAATERQRARGHRAATGATSERGWTRADLYERGGHRW